MKDKQTLLWLYNNSKKQIIPLLLLILCSGLLAVCAVSFALVSRKVIDSAVSGHGNIVVRQIIWLMAVILFQFTMRIFSRGLEISIQGKLELKYRHDLIGKIMQKDFVQASRYHTGDILNRLTTDIGIVSEGTAVIIPEIAALLTRLIGAISVLYVFDAVFSFVLIFGGLLLFMTGNFFRKKLKYLHKNMQEKDGKVRSFMQEIFEILVVIKAFGAEHEIETKITEQGRELYKAKVKKSTAGILANSGFSLIFSFGYLYALGWGASGLITGSITYGTLTAVLQLVGQVQLPFAGLSGLLPKIYGVIASAERVIELETLPDEKQRNKTEIHIVTVCNDLERVELSDVSYRYDRDMIFNGANLIINKGDFVVIGGRSGIGKSTLFLLLLGVIEQTEGTITVKLKNSGLIPIDKHTRKMFAYVPQGKLLLSGTVRESISFGRMKATDEEIMAAAEVSCASDFISDLPCGLDTVIGEKGIGLSEGQVQRLMIARAVLCGAPILLLDEATSALDEATEIKLLENIKRLTDRTCLIISHRKAAFVLCNKEIHIKKGMLKTIERSDSRNYETA